ncbi:alpha/beta hydrolase [Novosphingobium guangzhouense]|uniref:Esterase n=1 Tax=Novosphingobium guangzhouense TaxID=1850347 RepID=A0A2K2G761_9SPHN|nr:alpha/beta hydrolase-fold protein [Novosphingobium guangzhouense]PNU06859.1 hypothetical protein A8V01_01430 [Novosphingobium guangzhouense]
MLPALLSAAASLLALTPATATGADAAPEASGYTLPGTQVFEMRNSQGEPYRIFVSAPEGPAPANGFPVLYVLDGNAMFASFAEARRVQERIGAEPSSDPGPGGTIVVGIGYPTDRAYEGARRLYDFTPPNLPQLPPVQQSLAKFKTGGRDAFLAFLLRSIRPEIARRYKVDANRQALYGHSLAGYFALHTLYSHPDAFDAVIAASPSQWWNDQEILTQERTFALRLTQGRAPQRMARILLLAGDREERTEIVHDAEALADRLKPLSTYGLRSRAEIFKGETHITVPSRSVTTALRWAAGSP